MYSPKINENQIKRLHRLRELRKAEGQKETMTRMVGEAIEKYLTESESKKKVEIQLDKIPK